MDFLKTVGSPPQMSAHRIKTAPAFFGPFHVFSSLFMAYCLLFYIYLTFNSVSPLEYKLLEGQDVFLSPCAIIPPLGNYLADIQRTSPLCREGMARNVCP